MTAGYTEVLLKREPTAPVLPLLNDPATGSLNIMGFD